MASELSNRLGEKLLSIPDSERKGLFSYDLHDGECVGFVFPIHSWGMPNCVERFVRQLSFANLKADTYIYMVCTCGDDVGNTVDMFKRALGGKRLSMAISVQMPNTYILLPGFDVDDVELQQFKLRNAERRIDRIVSVIKNRENLVDVEKGKFPWLKSSVIYPLFMKYHVNDKKFRVNKAKCVKCGACKKVCPMENISLSDGFPKWNGNCSLCLACMHICKTRAIMYGNKADSKGRYFFGKSEK